MYDRLSFLLLSQKSNNKEIFPDLDKLEMLVSRFQLFFVYSPQKIKLFF